MVAKKRAQPKSGATAGRFAYDGLQREIHEKARLGIMASLATRSDGLAFAELKELCALTDGNLNRHLRVLSDAGLVEVRKDQKTNRPHTVCRLTKSGRKRFLVYIQELERVVSDALDSRENESSASERLPGWSSA